MDKKYDIHRYIYLSSLSLLIALGAAALTAVAITTRHVHKKQINADTSGMDIEGRSWTDVEVKRRKITQFITQNKSTLTTMIEITITTSITTAIISVLSRQK